MASTEATTDTASAGPAEQQPRGHESIHHAKMAVMRNCRYVQKQKSKGLPYSYAGVEDLVALLQDELLANGITVSLAAVHETKISSFTNKSGGHVTEATVECEYRFAHADSKTTESQHAVGYAQCTGDKAVSKAMTAALKVALRQYFLIETGDDDPDREHIEQQSAASRTATSERGQSAPKQGDPLSRCFAAIEKATSTEVLNKILRRATELCSDGTFSDRQLQDVTTRVMDRKSKINRTTGE